MKKELVIKRILIGVIILITSFFILKTYFIFKNNIEQSVVFSLDQSNSALFLQISNQITGWFKDFFHFNQLRAQVKNLQTENNVLMSQLVNLKNLEEENASLAKAFNVKQNTGWHLAPAQIILVDPSGLMGTFWINKGQKNGLKAGMNVILDNRVLVGILKECFADYCKGESIFAPQTKIGVRDLQSKVLAVAERNKHGNFILKLVPRGADIKPDDILITSSENKNFVQGLLVAKIKSIIPSDSALQEYILTPLFIQNQIFSVFIITDFIPTNVSSY